MKIICSWCRGEGQQGVVGEKAPLDDRRETHGICTTHRLAVQARWNDVLHGADRTVARLVSAGEDHPAPSNTGSLVASSAAHLWAGLRNLTRRTGA